MNYNPGGPDNDSEIKYSVSNGGPAPENVTERIYQKTKMITKYKVIEGPVVSRCLMNWEMLTLIVAVL